MSEAGQGPLPRVVILGRQNVGKSTLANRLAGRRAAIAHETPGVTRDRIEIEAGWHGRTFVLVDTGGFAMRARGIELPVAVQAERAAAAADLILLLVDASTGVQEEDAILAKKLHRLPAPVLVVANKVDGPAQEPGANAFHALGLGDPLPVSALHGRGSGELLDRIVELTPDRAQAQVEDETRFALVGRPNVGKSSLFNRLVREERAVVHEKAGTTRDAVDSVIQTGGIPIRFVDTAGLRRPLRTKDVEYYGLVRSLEAVGRSDVALLVVDASEGIVGEDKRAAVCVMEAGRGMAVALNKWDLVPSAERADLFAALSADLGAFPGTPVLRTSALSGMGVHRLIPALLAVHRAWDARAPTSEVNRVVRAAVSGHPIPRGGGQIRYATQTSARPPTFVFFGAPDPPASYRRYLENSLRKAFRLGGVPLRLKFRPKQSHRSSRDLGPVSRRRKRGGG